MSVLLTAACLALGCVGSALLIYVLVEIDARTTSEPLVLKSEDRRHRRASRFVA